MHKMSPRHLYELDVLEGEDTIRYGPGKCSLRQALLAVWHLVGVKQGRDGRLGKSWVQRAVTDLRLAAGAKLASPHVRAVRFGTMSTKVSCFLAAAPRLVVHRAEMQGWNTFSPL